jgi:hypothetical protein
MLSTLVPLLVALGVFGGLLIAFYIGATFFHSSAEVKDDFGVIQGATLGIVGLVVGFSLSGATGRFVDRQDLIVSEANAIGTAWLRADLLSESARDKLKATLKQYAESRLDLVHAADGEREATLQSGLAKLQADAWSIATADLRDRPQVGVLVLPPLNEVFDLLGKRNAVARRHMPLPTAALLFLSAALGAALLGHGQYHKPRSVRIAAMSVVLLIAGLIWATLDLDFPQRGLIRVSTEPLIDLLATMKSQA